MKRIADWILERNNDTIENIPMRASSSDCKNVRLVRRSGYDSVIARENCWNEISAKSS